MRYELVEGPLPEEVGQPLQALHDQVFEPNAGILTYYHQHPAPTAALAFDADRLVGFKLGYERKPNHYYSWLGAVDPACRRQGVARRLLDLQHDWCRAHGYQSIRTATKNKWRGMLILNLVCGFDVIGAYTDEHGEPKLILSKRLG